MITIIFSILALGISSLTLYVTYLVSNDSIKIDIQFAMEEVFRFFKWVSGDKKYRDTVKLLGESGQLVVSSGVISKQKYSHFRASTMRWKPSITSLLLLLVSLYLLLIQTIVFIGELHKKLLYLFQ